MLARLFLSPPIYLPTIYKILIVLTRDAVLITHVYSRKFARIYLVLVYTIQAISRGKRGLKRGIIKPSMLPIEVKTQQDPKQIDQVRIVPRNGHYVVEVIYSKAPVQAHVDPAFCGAIDLGVTNLAAITANREGFIPRLVNGRTLKAMNQ